ncbi:MAG TPA: universal stress protein [Pirellulales bacterium]|nr:universal stress protein [Pirellulales bacterium]
MLIHNILLPTDFSPGADAAFEAACSLAEHYGASILVLHVAVPPVAGQSGPTPPPQGDWQALEDRLAQIRPKNERLPVKHLMQLGMPASEIVRIAGETHPDLIVMGTHGRTGFRRLLMGSVAEEVVRKAPCSVLTVKTPETAA